MRAKVRQDLLTNIRCKQYEMVTTAIEETMLNLTVKQETKYETLEYRHLVKAWESLSISKQEMLALQNTLNQNGLDTAICETFIKMIDEIQRKKVSLDSLKELSKESLKVTISDQFVRFVELAVIAVTSHIPAISNETFSSVLVFIVVVSLSSVGLTLKGKKG